MREREFHFNQDGLTHPIGKPVNDRDQASVLLTIYPRLYRGHIS